VIDEADDDGAQDPEVRRIVTRTLIRDAESGRRLAEAVLGAVPA
jgi:hypothetical protein